MQLILTNHMGSQSDGYVHILIIWLLLSIVYLIEKKVAYRIIQIMEKKKKKVAYMRA